MVVLARRAALRGALAAAGLAAAITVPGCGNSDHRAPARPRHTAHAASQRQDCIARPSACGYPDRTNTGVPAGVKLTPSQGITVTQAGTVIAGRDVRGSIEVDANNVTIRDTRVTTAAATGHNILIGAGVSGTTIEDTTLRGVDTGRGAVQYAVQNTGTRATRGLRLQMIHCTTCWAGPGVLEDSYAITDAVIAGSHYEPVYYGGHAGPLVVDHDTLLNPHDQTAAVFAGNDYGDQTGLRITNNLLAGGGYMIYGGAYGPMGSMTRDVRITGNRFSRVYWPQGGHYGVAAYVNWSVTTWARNRWDATGEIEPAGK